MILALALSVALATPAPRVVPERRYDARLVRVVDADTIDALITARAVVRMPGQDVELSTQILDTVRLAGVNAPETFRPACPAEKKLGLEAKAFVEDRLRGEQIVLVTRGEEREKFGRVLGDIEVGGLSISKELIRMKLADPYDGGKRDPTRWCR